MFCIINIDSKMSIKVNVGRAARRVARPSPTPHSLPDRQVSSDINRPAFIAL